MKVTPLVEKVLNDILDNIAKSTEIIETAEEYDTVIQLLKDNL